MKSNTDFIRTLRKHNSQSRWTAQHRYDHLQLSYFAPDKENIPVTIEMLEDRLNGHDTLNELVYQLEMELMPSGSRLASYLQKICMIFSDYSDEKIASAYLKKILEVIYPMLIMVNGSCQQQDMFCEHLWDRLCKPGDIQEEDDLNSEIADELEDLEKYLKELETNYDSIWNFIEAERTIHSNLSLTTPVEQYLTVLLELLERAMQQINSSILKFSNCCLELKSLEIQAELN